MICGLDRDTKITDITETLKSLNYSTLKVSQIISYKIKKHMPLFQIHLDDNETNKSIFKLNELLHQYVVVERYKKPTRITQCYRCQYFHHTNCKLDPRCIKWDNPGHEYKDCPLGTDKVDQVTCCSCKQVGHPANYRGCPKFPENVKAAQKIQSSCVNKNKSFYSQFTNSARQNPIPNL